MNTRKFFVLFSAFALCTALLSCDQNFWYNGSANDGSNNGGGYSEYDKQVFDAVNARRGTNLIWDDKVYEQCKIHSENMASGKVAFSHDGFNTRIKNLGGNGAENVAYNSSDDPNYVVNQWMNSSGHKANIMNKAYKKSAVAAVKSDSGAWYYTQIFIP
ncbi:MAG: CAP domain-containing protein [Treponemataceae bacterium]|nr:CAP domain-containing protein [Treponemataceae bacterium]